MDGGAAIPTADRERWSRQLAGAVAHMHERGIVHRDLNPWNVFVVNEGGKENVKIGDFGLSVRCAVGDALSGEATAGAAPLDASAIGSLYSAPELGSDSYGHSADVFSLGVTPFVIWAADPSKRTLDDVITAVEALHDTGKLDGSGKTGGFASECLLAPLLERCASHDVPSRPTAAECAAAWQQSAAVGGQGAVGAPPRASRRVDAQHQLGGRTQRPRPRRRSSTRHSRTRDGSRWRSWRATPSSPSPK